MVHPPVRPNLVLCLLLLILTTSAIRAETEQEHQARYMKYMRQEYTFYGWTLVFEVGAQQHFTYPLGATSPAASPGVGRPSGEDGLQHLQITYWAEANGHVYAYATFAPTPSKEMATQI